MTERYRFFGSATGDTRQYSQVDFAEVFARFLRNGVIPNVGGGLAVTEVNPLNMAVQVGTGEGWIQGYWYENDAAKEIALTAADATNPRIDRVVLQLDAITDRVIQTIVLTGTPAAGPVAPALTRTDQIWELSLAQVYVGAGVTSVSNANITDERDDTVLCGWAVAPAIEVHTHDGTTGEGPRITATGLADGAATDLVIGDRTADQTVAPTSNTGKLTNFISWFANMIKAITGKADWKTAPATTLEAASGHIASTANPHNTTAAQVGALVSIDGVSNAGGNVDLLAGTNITITPDDANNAITLATTAEVNQNAFSNVKVGATTIAADIKTDTLEFVAGSGITLTPDATNDKLTIAASGATIASGSYTGDSADGRTITVGFTPKVVFITRTGTGASGSNSSISEIYMFDESAAYMGDSSDADNVVRSYAQDSMGKIVTNGFTVSFTRRTNVGNWTYGWVALV